ncbi:MAG TPA: aminoglycoside phosphotransferase, partial [Thioalkalivibrio sp.]|nr:aminoglycoside phosphotransferase [Thioalkalivibrio sp.]
MTNDTRLNGLHDWLTRETDLGAFELAPASADASFRRYFRVTTTAGSFVAMDAPPDKEDSQPFVAIDRKLEAAGVNVPHIHALDLAQGYLLLSDFGNRHFLSALDEASVDALYGDALEALLRIQQAPASDLPPYDRPLLWREMELFREWFLGTHLGLDLDAGQHACLDDGFEALTRAALEQPRVFVHRDYHSRNLMVTPEHNPGVLDFQDAVHGPVTYDLVSLLRDCYIAWPRQRVERWALDYRDRAAAAGILDAVNDRDFLRWFDLMGIQRHLKAIGIFARLKHRD